MDQFNATVTGIFILFIGIEVVLSTCLDLNNYWLRDSLANFSIAIVNAFLNIFFKALAFVGYQMLWNLAPVHFKGGWITWMLLFLLTDLFYYLFHILGHKCRFFWASHVVHHSSEKFNLTTALRSGVTNTPFRFAFSAPLVLLGFAPAQVLLMDSLVLIYTFFIHTELVGRLGWLEKFLNTPSHHRVHHGSDDVYLDKNFGGVLIIWDKVFGTFHSEKERPVYGLTKPLDTFNPVKIAFHEWVALLKDVFRSSSWEVRFQYAFGKPGWKPSARMTEYSPKTFTMMARVMALVVLSIGTIEAQPVDELLRQARLLDTGWQDEAALARYEEILKSDPANFEALVRSSRLLCNIGGRSKNKEFKKGHAVRASQLAQRAIRINNFDTEAHFNYTISIGMLAEMADSPREKLGNAKIIKSQAEYILSLDSNYAPAYYILGKWHFAVASLSALEIIICNMLFGGVPEGASMEKSIEYYNKAIALWPDYIVFHYGQAQVFNSLGQHRETILALETALKLPAHDPDDYGRIQKCQRLLRQIKQNL